MKLKKMLYLLIGFLGVVLGAIEAVVPMLPAFPFLLMAAFGFGKSSERLERWFKGTRLYRENLEDFVSKRGMTRKAKIRIMLTVTILMSIGFVMMHAVAVGRVVLVCVWVFHVLYFVFGIRTLPANQTEQG